MKTYRSPGGEQRLWFEPAEIESIAEDELKRAGLYPSLEDSVVDVERFVERYLHAELDQYAKLDADVLGMTVFAPGRTPRVSLNSDLTSSALDEEESAPGLHGRWRATLAHEGAHIILHRSLFEFADPSQTQLFDAGAEVSSGQLLRCLKRDVGFTQGRDWREVQANRGMAAILMPKGLVLRVAETTFEDLGTVSGVPVIGSSEERAAAGTLSARFHVSRQAATIRLQTLGCVAGGDDRLNISL